MLGKCDSWSMLKDNTSFSQEVKKSEIESLPSPCFSTLFLTMKFDQTLENVQM